MVKQLFSTIIMTLLYVLFLIYYISLLLLFPLLWIKYRVLPYKKRLIEIELMVRVIDLSLTVKGVFEGLLGTKKIYRTGEKEKMLPSVFYISKKDFFKFAEYIKGRESKKTVVATLEISYWKYGFGKSRLVSHKLLDRTPLIRK